MLKKYIFITAAIASAVLSLDGNALAQTTAAGIQTLPSGTSITYGSPGDYPIIIAILSQAGATSGTHTFTTWSFLAQDSTGSLDIFSSLSGLGYTPTVGDTISLNGAYAPFHQIAEVGSVSSITPISSGNPVPAPSVFTIPQLNVSTLSTSISGQLIELNNVTISTGSGNLSSGLFPTFAQGTTPTETYTITDSANNSMTMFDWVTSYSASAALGGTPVPTGPVNLIGFDSVFTSGSTSSAEFTPIAIVPAPEPTTLGLLGAGGLLLTAAVRRRLAIKN